MPDFIPVPWIQWQRFRVEGIVREHESGRPLPGVMVCAFDKDVVKDDFLGQCQTDDEGRFTIRFTDADFKDALETRPDLYLCVFVPGHAEPIHDTSCAVRRNATDEEYFEVEIPRSSLPG
jgi:carotenoid cleavage dioxygenase